MRDFKNKVGEKKIKCDTTSREQLFLLLSFNKIDITIFFNLKYKAINFCNKTNISYYICDPKTLKYESVGR